MLPVILRANFETPVETAQDVADRNLRAFSYGTSKDLKWSQLLRLHPNPVYNQIAKNYDIHWGSEYNNDSDGRVFDTYRQGVFGNNTHVYLIPCIRSWMLRVGEWYRSRESVEGAYFSPPLTCEDPPPRLA